MASRKNKVIEKAKEELDYLTGDELLRRKAELREKWVRDREAEMSYAREEGLRQGIQEGIEKGMEQGIERGIEQGIEQGIKHGVEKNKIETVIEMLKLGMEKEMICQVTKMSMEEVEKIQNQKE